MRRVQQVLRVITGIAASLALLAAAVAAGSSATAATTAATQTGSVLGRIAQLGLGLLQFVAGAGGVKAAAAGGPVAQAAAAVVPAAFGRCVVFAGVAVLSWLVGQQLSQLEGKLLHGDYPPPRNTDRA
jgi:hypothetical protein